MSAAGYTVVHYRNNQLIKKQLLEATKRANNAELARIRSLPSSNTVKETNTASVNDTISTPSANGSDAFNLDQSQDGCGTPFETSFQTIRKYDSTRLWNSPEIITGGINGKSAWCKVNGSLVIKVIVAPIDKVIIDGTAVSSSTSTTSPPPITPTTPTVTGSGTSNCHVAAYVCDIYGN